MTPAALKRFTCKDLAQMAKKQGVPGWHSMRKDQLVRAIIKANKMTKAGRGSKAARTKPAAPRGRAKSTAGNGSAKCKQQVRTSSSGARSSQRSKGTRPQARKRIRQLQSKLDEIRNLAATPQAGQTEEQPIKDRLVVMVRDPYWLHAYWELSQANVRRARTAMGQRWHTARPVLRLLHLAADGSASLLRNIPIHGGVNNWYVDVLDPPNQFRLEIGYLATDGHFHRLAASNPVATPSVGSCDVVDENWTDVEQNADRIFAMSGGYAPEGGNRELQELLEERLGRPMGSPMQTRFGTGAALGHADEFDLAVDAEMIVYGATHADAHVTLRGEPVQLRSDGTFAVRLSMPDRRQVIPVVATSSDGMEQRTISIAVERNTKAMEPVHRDGRR